VPGAKSDLRGFDYVMEKVYLLRVQSLKGLRIIRYDEEIGRYTGTECCGGEDSGLDMHLDGRRSLYPTVCREECRNAMRTQLVFICQVEGCLMYY
jgi:hypothetical protein